MSDAKMICCGSGSQRRVRRSGNYFWNLRKELWTREQLEACTEKQFIWVYSLDKRTMTSTRAAEEWNRKLVVVAQSQ